MASTGFNVRVYGIMINDKKQVLVSDEYIRGGYYTKFPGGGLEFGEGTLECIVREWQEELGQSVEVAEHIYTTDFFQISAFDNETQIISIYYLVKPLSPFLAVPLSQPFDFAVPEGAEEIEHPRWMDWDDFSAAAVTLPIDKVVADIIKNKY
ncbi:NUDIX domain-containing protein [Chitinophaga nivalis]|uniref:NUDIX domain-containing protein n=1 Tax=Chitinophaga nivalis TaxID=2991709 RepID=A0ABT3INR0_9BACT|nr:NUDIX domain-containing protein [Chitinophaga nivalis]MCW3464715.1 NUDIX domain-containing protein [Chitinophaga nivalis]MCW3485594.1 NUDIX domain-containing protein [Chitinophaga nivalis]